MDIFSNHNGELLDNLVQTGKDWAQVINEFTFF